MPTPHRRPGLTRKFGGPTLQAKAIQFGDNFIKSLIYDCSRRGPASILSMTGSICRENTYDEFRR